MPDTSKLQDNKYPTGHLVSKLMSTRSEMVAPHPHPNAGTDGSQAPTHTTLETLC